MKRPEQQEAVEIESFRHSAAAQAPICLRPLPGQKYAPSVLVEGNKSLIKDYPVGTRFKVRTSLRQRPDGTNYLFSSWQWDVQVLEAPDRAA